MAARFEAVIPATRVPRETERALRDLARAEDRSLASYLRRALMELAVNRSTTDAQARDRDAAGE